MPSLTRRATLFGLMSLPFAVEAADSGSAATTAFEDPFTGFRFPRLLGGFMFQRQGQYARVQLGYGVHYVERTGATATISVYDLNLSGIEDGTTDQRVKEEYERTEETIALIAKQGGYKGMRRLDNLPSLSKAWLQMNHELVRPDGRSTFSYSFIRGQSRKFVRVHITATSQNMYGRLPMFLLAVSRAIGMMS